VWFSLALPWLLFGGLALWLLGQDHDPVRVVRGVGVGVAVALAALAAGWAAIDAASESTCGAVLSAVGAGGGSGGWISLHCMSLGLLAIPVVGTGGFFGLAGWAFRPGGPGRAGRPGV